MWGLAKKLVGSRALRSGVATAAVSLSGAASLLVLLNTPTQMLAACCVAPVALYPLMKRVSWWPQAFLGLTFNWGVLMGSTAVLGSLSPAAVWLYAGCAAWTVSYDTIYGHQDKRDDAALGLKSSSLLDDRVGNVIPLTSALAAAGLWCTALAVQHHSAYACVAAFPASAWAVWLALRGTRTGQTLLAANLTISQSIRLMLPAAGALSNGLCGWARS